MRQARLSNERGQVAIPCNSNRGDLFPHESNFVLGVGNMMKDDDLFFDVDNKLYKLINPLLANGNKDYQMNADKKTFNWYCGIRNNIVNKIEERKK